MNALRSFTALLLASTLFSSCNTSLFDSTIRGEGPFIEVQREIESFDRISIEGGMQLNVVVGEPQAVVIHADTNLHQYIRTRIVDNTLKIDFTQSVSTPNHFMADIHVPTLAGISISGSSNLNIRNIDGASFSLDAAGSISGSLAGKTTALEIDIAGSSKLDTYALQTEKVTIDVAGSANLKVQASDQLDVDGAGSIRVTYRGAPAVTWDLAGSGKVVADQGSDDE